MQPASNVKREGTLVFSVFPRTRLVDVDSPTSADSTHSDYDLTTFLDVETTTTLKGNLQEVVFKLDTGAKVTAMSEIVYQSLANVSLQKSTRSLVGPAQHKLQVLGEFTAKLSHNEKCSEQPAYVVRNLKSNDCQLSSHSI